MKPDSSPLAREIVMTVSDCRDREFGLVYGVRMKATGLLARVVFVVGKDGGITYMQIVPETSELPNFDAALAAARAAAGA